MNPAAVAARVPITLGIMMAAVMSALDTTVANIALPHMQGSLSASPEQITWVLTSYIVAAAVTTPISGWLAARLGLKPMLLMVIAGFSVVSVLCGMATSLPEMVVFRIMQGMVAAPLMPLAQAVLMNINPPERYGRAMALFTMAAVVAPVMGPVVGGYLTEDLSWRWCFYINVPAGIGSMLLLWIFLPSEKPQPRPFDFLGFAALAVAIAAFQLMLDRGPSQDWFGSREIWVWALLAAGAFWIYLTHTLTAAHPLFPPALARDHNFVTTTIFGFFFSVLSFASLTLLPLLMQGVMGYPVIYSGLISMPRGLAMMAVLQVSGRIDGVVDRRLLVAIGFSVMILAFWQMAHFDLGMSSRQILIASTLQGVGQGIIFVPIATLACATIKPALRPDASAISNLLRSLGGSVGIALMQAMMAVNTQTMHASLAGHVRPDDPVFRAALPGGLSPETAGALNAEISRQATMVGFVDDFRLMTVIGIFCLPLVFLLRQPKPGAKPATDTAVEAHVG